MSVRHLRNRRVRQVAALRKRLQRRGHELGHRRLPWRGGVAATRIGYRVSLMVDGRLSVRRQLALIDRLLPYVDRVGPAVLYSLPDRSVWLAD